MLLYEERELVRVNCLKMLETGLTSGTGGNISVCNREKGLYAISPTSMDYHKITPEDVMVVDFEGKVVEGNRKPSIEHVMHRVFYTDRDDINAVVHTHSPYATAVSCMGVSLPAVAVLIRLGGSYEVPCAPYAYPGTQELADVAFETMKGLRAVLLQNHGLIAGGRDIEHAMLIAGEMEYLSQLYCIVKSTGVEPTIIPKEVLGFSEGA
jgi:L-fuculose-phosphate aldolase